MIEAVQHSRRLNGYGGMEQRRDHDMAPYFPSFAYDEYLEARRAAGASSRPELYFSLAITSGGYRRDKLLEQFLVIENNTDYGFALRQLLSEHGITDQQSIIPSELGYMGNASWGQLDYLMFCYHTMSGITVEQAGAIEKELMGLMGGERVYGPGKWEQNAKLEGSSHEEAWRQYEEFTRRYVAALQNIDNYDAKEQSVRGLVGVLDNDLSLGSRAEKLWAELMGVPYYELEVQRARAPEALVGHVDQLEALGASAIHLTNMPGPSLTFVRPRTLC